ncbi:MAG TPA: 3-phosphoshikimate 1-carboxyvinyltransferase [Alphaproteobacteria bacterium]|nr:3-phosphoshikimate 1-carboxyvinyltransferase [Alphaproteobacteria bacterium]
MPPASELRMLVSRPVSGLKGSLRPPGDKSISHRALILGACAIGVTEIDGLLGAADVAATAGALEALGARIERGADGRVSVTGVGVGGLCEPASVLDFGNSGTGARLLMGAVASHAMRATFTGDASLSGRPMGRVIAPLQAMGAQIAARRDNLLPLTIDGAADPVPIEYAMPVASAQVKSAVLLAGLNTPGVTSVIETAPTRDHTETMLRHFGAEVGIVDGASGPHGAGRIISVTGYTEIEARPVTVPADPSSAAFPLVAALITAGSEITLERVGINPLRAGLIVCLREMGAEIETTGEGEECGEPVADITARTSALQGITVPAGRAPSMIDEYPALAVAAAFARGTTILEGLGELRVKESDRLAAIARGLMACGVEVEEGEASLAIHGLGGGQGGGRGGAPRGLAKDAPPIETHGDHRIAMAFLALGAGAQTPVAVDGGEMIATSFPDFPGFMNALGADIAETDEPGRRPARKARP